MAGHVGLCFISVKLQSEIGQHLSINEEGRLLLRMRCCCLGKVHLELGGGERKEKEGTLEETICVSFVLS